jgi:hypothetical protein
MAESKFEGLGIACFVLGVVVGLILWLGPGCAYVKSEGLAIQNPRALGLAFACFVGGVLAHVLFTACAEVVRVLKVVAGLPYSGTIAGGAATTPTAPAVGKEGT